MAEYTKGPWSLAVHTGNGGPISPGDDWTIYGAGENYAIAYEGGHNPCADADARLIAAAPTMYEFIEARASAGDEEAASILETINGRA